jgi:hypothetical protein
MTFSFDPDAERIIDETALLMAIAAEYGMSAVMENHPGLGEVKTIAGIQEFVRRIDKPNFKLMIEAIHAAYQHEVDLVATVELSLIGYPPCSGRCETSSKTKTSAESSDIMVSTERCNAVAGPAASLIVHVSKLHQPAPAKPFAD